MRRIVTGLLLLALLVGVLAACGDQSTTLEPKAAAEAFLTAMGERNYENAYKLLSMDTRATVTQEQFAEMVELAWQSAGVTGFQVKQVLDEVRAKNDTRASVPYQATLSTADGSTDVFNALSLVLQDGQWLVVWPPAR